MHYNEISLALKALGKGLIMELVKSKWVQFCVGLAILLMSAPSFVSAIRWW